jgi:hypothetical protein
VDVLYLTKEVAVSSRKEGNMARNEMIARLKERLDEVELALMTANCAELPMLEAIRDQISVQLAALTNHSPARSPLKAA